MCYPSWCGGTQVIVLALLVGTQVFGRRRSLVRYPFPSPLSLSAPTLHWLAGRVLQRAMISRSSSCMCFSSSVCDFVHSMQAVCETAENPFCYLCQVALKPCPTFPRAPPVRTGVSYVRLSLQPGRPGSNRLN